MTIEEATRESYVRQGVSKQEIEIAMAILTANCGGIGKRHLVPGTEEEFIVGMMKGTALDYHKFVSGEKGFSA